MISFSLSNGVDVCQTTHQADVRPPTTQFCCCTRRKRKSLPAHEAATRWPQPRGPRSGIPRSRDTLPSPACSSSAVSRCSPGSGGGRRGGGSVPAGFHPILEVGPAPTRIWLHPRPRPDRRQAASAVERARRRRPIPPSQRRRRRLAAPLQSPGSLAVGAARAAPSHGRRYSR